MSNIVLKNQPCVDTEGCGSSDALQIYEAGDGFCFSCSKKFKKEEIAGASTGVVFKKKPSNQMIKWDPDEELEKVKDYPIRGFVERNINKPITTFYGVKVSYNGDGDINKHYYPYDGGLAYHVRKVLPDKDFFWIKESKSLFGKELFNPGGKRLVICEGEIDTMAVAKASYEKYGKFYPVIGIAGSSMTEALLEARDWIRSFQEVIICFDEDEPGQKAVSKALKIIGLDKAKITRLPENDAGAVLLEHGHKALMQCIFDAASFVPSGFITKEALWDSLVEYNSKVSTPYPFCINSLNEKLKGRRGGDIALFISGTGSGKSTLIREIGLDIIQNSDEKIGIVNLEESPHETARKFAGMALMRNPADEEIPIDELKPGFDEVFGDDRCLVLDHQGSMNDSSIIDKLEYMALSGYTSIFIDHITILVSEGVENLTGNEAQDKVMNDLLRLVKRYPDVWIGLVSHLRKVPGGTVSFEEGKMPTMDDIRGSGSIKQVSMDIIAFARNMVAETVEERNRIDMRVLKCRFTGLTGDVDPAFYDFPTGRLTADVPDIPEKEETSEQTEFTKV
ncbi:MAG: toprim domain-containing protein [Gammaproteobacteria bacterium]|nr:toprim domain-containing protein [Gammaproteobacteria bacterium]